MTGILPVRSDLAHRSVPSFLTAQFRQSVGTLVWFERRILTTIPDHRAGVPSVFDDLRGLPDRLPRKKTKLNIRTFDCENVP